MVVVYILILLSSYLFFEKAIRPNDVSKLYQEAGSPKTELIFDIRQC